MLTPRIQPFYYCTFTGIYRSFCNMLGNMFRPEEFLAVVSRGGTICIYIYIIV